MLQRLLQVVCQASPWPQLLFAAAVAAPRNRSAHSRWTVVAERPPLLQGVLAVLLLGLAPMTSAASSVVASSAASYDESDVVDPGFADYARLNFTLLPNSPIWKALPNWRAIPFNEMGLMVDGEYRTMVPTDAEVGRLALAPGTKGGPPLPKTKKMASSPPCRASRRTRRAMTRLE